MSRNCGVYPPAGPWQGSRSCILRTSHPKLMGRPGPLAYNLISAWIADSGSGDSHYCPLLSLRCRRDISIFDAAEVLEFEAISNLFITCSLASIKLVSMNPPKLRSALSQRLRAARLPSCNPITSNALNFMRRHKEVDEDAIRKRLRRHVRSMGSDFG